jgi:vacuolar protein sorting-associated protein 35
MSPDANSVAVITQVFPDEYHLHTLDQMLSAIARLNPHVNMKAIVIGLMDRLSSYAARESEAESPDERRKTEEEATAKLLEKMRISKEKKPEEPKMDPANAETQPNGTKPDNASTTESSAPTEDRPVTPATTEGEESSTPKSPSRSIASSIKLYEIFYDQVVNLVKTRGLPIQDTIALLVSLVNLAL